MSIKILEQPRVNFSLRKEVFFIMVGSFIGAFTMHSPIILFDLLGSTSYHITLLVAASVVDSTNPIIGFLLHLFVATIIGIVTGIFLHRIIKFNISNLPRGVIYGIITGVIVFVVFAIPVSQLLLDVNAAQIMSEINPGMTVDEASQSLQGSLVYNMLQSLALHIIWGTTLGVIGSLLTRKIGANYRCHKCNIEFSNIKTYQKHMLYVHENPSSNMKKILILGGGYAGVNVLKKVQNHFESDVNISIELVSESNFFLHTPMLPEMATGTIEPRHIATPVRNFCKRARFYQAKVKSIDVNSKKVIIQRNLDNKENTLSFDYLVIALGNKTNFFGNKNIEQNSITIKSLDDAIKIRNHIITVLEDADQESDPIIQSKLATFVVVGGGFSGVETAGEINEFVRVSCEKFYRNIDPTKIRIILIASGNVILPEIGTLGDYAKKSLKKAGVEIIFDTKLVDATKDTATLSNGDVIPCNTLIWAGGNKVDDVILNLDTQHHKSGRLITDDYMRLEHHPNVFALGDCAMIKDPKTQQFYPPTAQHAIRQAYTVSENLINSIYKEKNLPLHSFTYTTKGSMAKIGKKDGVALLMGHEFQGFFAWFIWKQYYLSSLPTFEKRIRVGLDWFIDLFFPRDITRLSSV
jgi:NADH dehydrogenase